MSQGQTDLEYVKHFYLHLDLQFLNSTFPNLKAVATP